MSSENRLTRPFNFYCTRHLLRLGVQNRNRRPVSTPWHFRPQRAFYPRNLGKQLRCKVCHMQAMWGRESANAVCTWGVRMLKKKFMMASRVVGATAVEITLQPPVVLDLVRRHNFWGNSSLWILLRVFLSGPKNVMFSQHWPSSFSMGHNGLTQ